jgi:hypothetical protein
MQMFAIATTMFDGSRGAFSEGPYPEFDPQWLQDDGLVFRIGEGGKARLAVEELVANASDMSRELFPKLQTIGEGMELAYAKGEDAVDGCDAAFSDVSAVLDVAPWSMHPDYGCVLSGDVTRLDSASEAGAAHRA